MKYFQSLMNLFIPNCEHVSKLTSQALDEPMTSRQKMGMKIHMLFCEFCRNNSEQLQLIRTMIQTKKKSKEKKEETKDQAMSSDAKNRINDILKSSDSNN